MAKWTGFYNVVTPHSASVTVSDNAADSLGAYGNYTWYRHIIGSSSKRITKYIEYDIMDMDIEIARALDTIAEEMIGNASTPGEDDLPISLDIENEESATMNNTFILTLRTALKYWCDMQDMHNRLFKICRQMVKYGDCFFEKDPKNPNQLWKFIHPKYVYGAMINPDDIHDVMGWIISNDPQKLMNTQSFVGTEFIKTPEQIVRFTLSDDMSEMMPFGESVLNSIYKTFKQKELLEDSIIIYRIQRAPERRVFYIDVGKMPPQRAKMYLEAMKNEIKQKKIPTQLNPNGGRETLDSIYNPMAMVEDIFIAQKSDGRGSKVEALPGGSQLGEISDLEYFQNKLWRGLRIPPSYMKSSSEGQAQYSDGKVGTAYILELRFSLYIQRLQGYVEKVLDEEFKKFMRVKNIHVDQTQFKLRLPEPSNFGMYRQQELDAQLLNSFSSADGVHYLSKRFIMSRYLGLDDEEIALNDKMVREERGIDPDSGEKDMVLVYNPPEPADDGMGGMGGGGGIGGGGGLGGMEGFGEYGGPDEDIGAPEAGAEGGETGAVPPTPTPNTPKK